LHLIKRSRRAFVSGARSNYDPIALIQRSDRNHPERARNAETNLAILALLMIAEKHVAVIDLTVDGYDI